MSKKSTITKWFHQYGNDVYRFLVYYTGSPDVEDLVQEVFVKALKNLDTYKKKSSPKTWLFTIAGNVGIDEKRSRKKRQWENFVPLDDSLLISEQNPETILLNNARSKEVINSIQLINENYWDVVTLRGINQFFVAETAALLNWPEDKVRTNYYRGLKALRKQWGEER